MFLQEEIEKLVSHFPDLKKQSEAISAKAVDWHIHHSFQVIINVCKLLHKSDPKLYKKKFNISWTYVTTRNSIPRGVGKAPKAVQSPEEIPLESIKKQIVEANELITSLSTLPANSYFKHPYFGMLNLKNTKKFLTLHTAHHLKIIRDIIR
jgi:hypothetical protein